MIQKSPVALGIPLDTTGTTMTSTNVNAGVIEAYNKAGASSKGFVLCSYGGNANTGRFLELFPGLSMDVAPLYSTASLDIVEIVARATATSTCTIGFYNLTTLLYTITFTAQTQVIVSAEPLFVLPATGALKVKVASGSINSPHLYFVTRGSA